MIGEAQNARPPRGPGYPCGRRLARRRWFPAGRRRQFVSIRVPMLVGGDTPVEPRAAPGQPPRKPVIRALRGGGGQGRGDGRAVPEEDGRRHGRTTRRRRQPSLFE